MSDQQAHCTGCELFQRLDGDTMPCCLNAISWTPDVPPDRRCFQPAPSVFADQITEGKLSADPLVGWFRLGENAAKTAKRRFKPRGKS